MALVLAFLFSLSGISELLDDRLGEVQARLADRAPSGQIAIVEIDARSIAALKKWPWSRRYYADLLNRLHGARASIIAFDVDFSAQSDPAGDQAFARALRNVQPVVLPIFQQRASDDPGERLMIKNRPAAEFASAWVGGVNILPGHDGVVRDFPAATMISGQIQPSMAALLSENDQLGDRTFIPDWSIDAEKIPRFSFIDVLNGRVTKALAGKRVIVGATAIELGDRYTVPRFGTVPGVVVQALAAESLLQHRTLSRSGLLPTLLGLLTVVLLLSRSLSDFKRTYPVVAALVAAAVLVGPFVIEWCWRICLHSSALLLATALAIVLRIVVETRHNIRARELRDLESGLPNERALEAASELRTGDDLSVVAASIDRFDQIRTTLGVEAATSVVVGVAKRIACHTGAQLYRMTPDTLAWLTTTANAERAADQVNDQFVEPIAIGDGAIDVQLTFGFSTAAPNAASLPQSALAAVNAARAAGVRAQWFQGIGPRARRDLSIMGDLRRGTAAGEVLVAYQPKLNLQTGTITNAEALVRWQHPVEGLIYPDRFIPLAEETGTVRELTRFVLRQAIADCSALSQAGQDVGISINVSALDISEPGFAEHVVSELGRSQLPPSRLTLEITEGAIIRSPATAHKVLHAIRELGVRLSIDDYGTGQSTLSYLKSLPVDELKIDKSFVTSVRTNVNDRIMVRSTIEMAHELGLSVVAEGAEDMETVSLLKELKCDHVQGYAIGKAAPRDALWPDIFGQARRKVA